MPDKQKRPEAPAQAPAPTADGQMGPERRPVAGSAPAPAAAPKTNQQQTEKNPASYGKG